MNIRLLNNTLTPSIILQGEKNILINTPKGVLKNIGINNVDKIIITFPDRFHTHDLKEFKGAPIYVLPEHKFNMRPYVNNENDIHDLIVNREFSKDVTPILLHKKDGRTVGLKINRLFIAPSFFMFTNKSFNQLKAIDVIFSSIKYEESNDRKDMCSLDYLQTVAKQSGVDVGIIGTSDRLKQKGIQVLDINRDIRKNNKIYDNKSFLYLCRENNMDKNFQGMFNTNARFDYVVGFEKKQTDSKDFFISGFASVPVVDRQDELISENALKKAAGDLLKPANRTVFLNHNYDRPIGTVTESKYMQGGLMIKVKISETEPIIRKQIEEGLWTSFSIGGIVHEIDQIQKDGRDILEIKDIELIEVSLVGIPANQEANLVEVISKSLTKTDKQITKEVKLSPVKRNIEELIKKGQDRELKQKSFNALNSFLHQPAHKQKVLEESYSYFKLALVAKALKETLNDDNWNIQKTVNFNWYGEPDRAVYSDLQIGRDVTEELLTDGYMFAEKNGQRMIVNIFPGMFSFHVWMYTSANDADSAKQFLTSYKEWMNENNWFKGEKITPLGKFLSIPENTFDDLKLEKDLKKAIKVGSLEFFNKKDVYKANRIPFKRGLIFAGEPGTGKTLTGKILMKETDSTFIWVTADDLDYKKDFQRLLQMAKELSPSVLFAEDIDDFLKLTGAVDAIKTQMDGLDSMDGVVTILCTNYPEQIPVSLIDRPSRFDDVLIFNLPDEKLRYEIMLAHINDTVVKDKEQVLKAIAKDSEGLTGSHLKEIVVYSILLASDEGRSELTEDDFKKALAKVKKTRELIRQMSNPTSQAVEEEKDTVKYLPDENDASYIQKQTNTEERSMNKPETDVPSQDLEKNIGTEDTQPEIEEQQDAVTEKVTEGQTSDAVATEQKSHEETTTEETVEEKVDVTKYQELLDKVAKLEETIKGLVKPTTEEVEQEETPTRKGVVDNEDENDEQFASLLKKIEKMSPQQIMDTPEVWNELDEELQKSIKNNYLRSMTK